MTSQDKLISVTKAIAEADGCNNEACRKHMDSYYRRLAQAAISELAKCELAEQAQELDMGY